MKSGTSKVLEAGFSFTATPAVIPDKTKTVQVSFVLSKDKNCINKGRGG